MVYTMTTEIVTKMKPHMHIDGSSVDDIKVADTARVIYSFSSECYFAVVSNDYGEEYVTSKGHIANWENSAPIYKTLFRHNRNIKITSAVLLVGGIFMLRPGGPMRPLATQ